MGNECNTLWAKMNTCTIITKCETWRWWTKCSLCLPRYTGDTSSPVILPCIFLLCWRLWDRSIILWEKSSLMKQVHLPSCYTSYWRWWFRWLECIFCWYPPWSVGGTFPWHNSRPKIHAYVIYLYNVYTNRIFHSIKIISSLVDNTNRFFVAITYLHH